MEPTLALMRLDAPDRPAFVRNWTGRAECSASGGRPNSLLARALIRFLVAQRGTRTRFSIAKDQRGKPSLVGTDGRAGPSISLTHSGSIVAAALSDCGALGIDIERHRTRDVSALAEAAFGPEERAAVLRHGYDAFYRIWTLREAHAKATGIGLAQAADRVDRFTTGPYRGSWATTLDGSVWRFAVHRVDGSFSLAIAQRREDSMAARDVAGPIGGIRAAPSARRRIALGCPETFNPFRETVVTSLRKRRNSKSSVSEWSADNF